MNNCFILEVNGLHGAKCRRIIDTFLNILFPDKWYDDIDDCTEQEWRDRKNVKAVFVNDNGECGWYDENHEYEVYELYNLNGTKKYTRLDYWMCDILEYEFERRNSIFIDGNKVEFNKDSISVGCTDVSYETIDKINKRINNILDNDED